MGYLPLGKPGEDILHEQGEGQVEGPVGVANVKGDQEHGLEGLADVRDERTAFGGDEGGGALRQGELEGLRDGDVARVGIA